MLILQEVKDVIHQVIESGKKVLHIDLSTQDNPATKSVLENSDSWCSLANRNLGCDLLGVARSTASQVMGASTVSCLTLQVAGSAPAAAYIPRNNTIDTLKRFC